MAEETGFAGEQPINSFLSTHAHQDDMRAVDKHVIVEDHFEIDESLMIDANLLTVSSLISTGGQSLVYKGRYKGAPVAIKILKPVTELAASSDDHKNKILREIMMLSRVKHENVVKFIGASANPTLVIVMEYMKSGSLKNYLYKVKPRGGLELKRSINFALDISRAMECLHMNSIIHRDLKPDNILLTENHKKLKLCDFGLARVETLTEKMTAGAGTPRWMAPELFSESSLKRGEKIHYDHKVDVYSFSMVFWEMLTNSMPYEGMGNIQAAYATRKNVRPSLEKVPKEIAPLLESCWAADPNQRPEFTHITRALSEFLKSLTSSPNAPPRLVTIEEEDDYIDQAVVMDSTSAIANALVVQEAKDNNSSLSSKLCNFFCFWKSSSPPEAI